MLSYQVSTFNDYFSSLFLDCRHHHTQFHSSNSSLCLANLWRLLPSFLPGDIYFFRVALAELGDDFAGDVLDGEDAA